MVRETCQHERLVYLEVNLHVLAAVPSYEAAVSTLHGKLWVHSVREGDCEGGGLARRGSGRW